ncbi:AMP-binding protein [Herbaspirillum sp. C7C8]|uniref:AMP-binding protein n=1 Tax=Herbaspirillum sp. C7C8 TaxID=2736665 RepID=UPI001F519E68|nr:AMP-binding protein [Herbaspirillum sp. C7C8]MCI1003453.1 AMP-binding protein [Herbaspirillum sp. C7C8]
MPATTRLDLLQLPFQAFDGERVIGWRDGVAVTYATWRAELLRWKQLLQTTPGQRFALFHQDTLHFAAALLGTWLAGKTAYLPSDALPDTCGQLRGEVDGFLGDFGVHWPALQPAPDASFDEPSSPWPALRADFAGLVVYTSGSTGQAQAIPKQLGQMANEVATLEALFGATVGQAEVVATVSHQHIYGLLFKVLWALCAGRPVHAGSAFFPEDLQRMAGNRPWLLLSSPAHLKRLPEQATQPDARQLRAIFSSGGPLPAEAACDAARLLGQRPLEIYGSSETGGIAWRQPDSDLLQRREHWQAMPGVSVRLGAEGELEVRSPHLPDSGWFSMADRAVLMEDIPAAFELRGRSDRIVKLEEKRISLTRIEQLLAASPLVEEVRVIVHQGRRARQFIAAFVVPTAQGQALLVAQGKLALNAALKTALAGAIEAIALPRLWRYLEALPVNSQGKVTLSALTALLESSAPTLPNVTELQRSTGQVQLALDIPADLLYFRGHFPGAPILPGVVQTDWSLTLGRRYFNLPPRFLGLQTLKFQRVITPGMRVLLDLQFDTAKSQLSFRLHSDAGQHASGRFLLGAA